MKLKGFTQLTERNSMVLDTKSYRFYGWYSEENNDLLKIKYIEEKITESGWHKNEIGGTDHQAFSKFHIWFEYED